MELCIVTSNQRFQICGVGHDRDGFIRGVVVASPESSTVIDPIWTESIGSSPSHLWKFCTVTAQVVINRFHQFQG